MSLIRKAYVYVPLLISIYLSVVGIISVSILLQETPVNIPVIVSSPIIGIARLNLVLNPLNTIFLLAFSLVGIPVTFYSLEYLSHHHRHEDPRHYWLYLSISYFFILFYFLSNNFLLFLFSLDAMVVFLGLLIAFDRTYVKARTAARIYIIMGLLASALIIMSLSIIYFETSTYSFTSLRETVKEDSASLPLFFALILGLIGFSIKSGIVPFHSWLPQAHGEAPTPISALLSGFVVSTGVYGLLLLTTSIGVVYDTIVLLGTSLGLISVVYGAIMALAQDDIKRLLAYSTISHMGYLLMMISTMYEHAWSSSIHERILGATVLSAIMFFILNHSIAKATLFLIAGNIISHIGTRDLNKMGGLYKEMKLDYIALLLASIVLIGLPPAIGFHSKTLYHTSILSKDPSTLVFDVSVAVFSTVITTSYLLKILYKGFIRETPHTRYYKITGRHEEKMPELMTYPLYILLATTIVIGLWREFILSVIGSNSIYMNIPKEALMRRLIQTPVFISFIPSTPGIIPSIMVLTITIAIIPLSLIIGFWFWTHIEELSYEFHKITGMIYHAYILNYTKRTLYTLVNKLEILEDNYWFTLLISLALLLAMLVMLLS